MDTSPAALTSSPVKTNSSPVETNSLPAEGAHQKAQSTSDRTTHTKKLSLNFPVLLPQHTNGASQSPNTSTPISPARSSPRTAASPVVEAPDFLTLLAGQERKVLELREELGKAENELLALKKQWANFEASKKKSELRQIAKLQPLPSGSGKDDSETERERYRILAQTSGQPRRHTSQRVFSSSRHTRQLSLLSPTSGEKPAIRHSLDSIASMSHEDVAEQPHLERTNNVPTPTVDSPKTLGKTYRDLANRNSLPPPSTDAIVRQGKQMAHDLKDGLWTFFEDIRQATVGEEAVSGIQGENSRPKMAKQRGSTNTLHRKKRFSKDNVHTHEQADSKMAATKDQSFWHEFGVDTPHKLDGTNRQVSDPLLDLDDEAWDTWESPQQKLEPVSGANAPVVSLKAGESMPWPQLTNLTPSKLTRTVSDIMKDWDAPIPAKTVGQDASERQAGQDHHVLISPHM